MALKKAGKKDKHVKQLSKDTAASINHNCHSLVELCRHLLATSYQYVYFGKFILDFLKKESCELRQGFSGTYFCSGSYRKGAYY